MRGGGGGIVEEPSLRRAWRAQRGVIGALVLREVHTRFGRQNVGYVWLFLEPMILAGCIAAIHLGIGKGLPGGLSIFAFYITGYTPYYMFRAVLNRASNALEENRMLLYHARIRPLDILVARNALDGAAVMIALAVFLVGVGVATGEWPRDWVMIGAGTVALLALVHGVALGLAAMSAFGAHTMDRFVHPATYLAIPFTGAFSMVWWFPTDVQELFLLNPTVHCFEMVRAGFFGDAVPTHFDPVFVLVCAAALNVAGMLALRAAEPHLDH